MTENQGFRGMVPPENRLKRAENGTTQKSDSKEREGFLMTKESMAEQTREQFLKLCPDVIEAIRNMIEDPDTPVSSRVALIGMVLDRALGKPETPVTVTTEDQSFEEAEAMLMEIVREIQMEEGMIPRITEGMEEVSEDEAGGDE